MQRLVVRTVAAVGENGLPFCLVAFIQRRLNSGLSHAGG